MLGGGTRLAGVARPPNDPSVTPRPDGPAPLGTTHLEAPVFDLINGIPVHPLVVHAVVVLLPLAVLGTIAMAVRPRWRLRYGFLVTAGALAAAVLVPVATSSGEALEKRVGDPGEHAELGDQLLWFAIPLVIVAGALWLLALRAARSGDTDSGPSKRVMTAVAVLAVLVGVANLYQVYRVGDSGAQVVWKDQVTAPAASVG